MKAKIHQTPEESLAESSQNTTDAVTQNGAKLDAINETIQGLHSTVSDRSQANSDAQGTIRKLDEIKSAHLITNKHLKDMSDKPSARLELPEPDEVAKAFFSMLRGKPGDAGITPKKGKDYFTPQEVASFKKEVTPTKGVDYADGVNGVTPRKGVDYFTLKEVEAFKKAVTPVKGKDYSDGKKGYTPQKGVDYDDGEPGKPGTEIEPDDVIKKIHASKQLISPYKVSGLPAILQTVEDLGRNQQGWQNVGGGIPPILLSNGVKISDLVTEINFSTNITAVYSGSGRVTLTATGGGGTTYSETPTGNIDGANTSYTTAHTITTVINLVINGQFIHPAEYTVSGAGFTMLTALDSSLTGKGFTIIYS